MPRAGAAPPPPPHAAGVQPCQEEASPSSIPRPAAAVACDLCPARAPPPAPAGTCPCRSRQTSVAALDDFLDSFPMKPSNPPNAALTASLGAEG